MADYRSTARRSAQKYGLDPDVFMRQINQESGFNPNARSPAGALGIAQIMPATARGWGVDPMNPTAALDAAAKNMKQYVDRYGGYENALRAYNAGPGNIQRSKSFAETNHYVSTILNGKTPKVSAPGKGDQGDGETAYDVKTTTTPGIDNRVARAQLIESFLSSKGSDPLDFAIQARGLRDVAPTSTTTRTPIPGSTSSDSGSDDFASSGSGAFKISGPQPGRLQKPLVSFAKKVADVYGDTLVGLDGSSHSKYTTTGNVSQHYTGNATDVFTIGGKRKGDPGWQQTLIAAGRAALIAAGMPRAKAMKAGIGLYNVGSHQIIFGTNSKALGGDHTDHLHISAR